MTEDDLTGHSSAGSADRTAAVLAPPQRRRRRLFGHKKRYNRRIRWLRLLALLVPTCFLGLISMVFGMVLAVEPQIGPLVASLKAHYTQGANSVLMSAPPLVRPIATLTDHQQFFLAPNDVPLDSLIAHAVISVEDKRFMTQPAIDYRGVARALVADVFSSGGTQGGSTITEQFVKTALNKGLPEQRTIVEKVKEAFTAFQLTHLWNKQKILTEYLNTANFGVATGIEAAAQAWFGNDPSSNLWHCGRNANVQVLSSLCVTYLTADQAALLAGIIDSPNTYVRLLTTDPQAVADRRNTVLHDMWEQGYLTQAEYEADTQVSLPSPLYVESPSEENTDPITGYFASWVANQLASSSQFKNIVYGGGSSVGDRMVRHPDIRVITLTGSRETGVKVLEAGAETLKHVHLELGGKNAIIVMDDADLDLAVNGIVWSAFGTSGQRCTAASRVIAHEKVYDALQKKLVAAVEKLRLGPGWEGDTDIGPVINKAALEKIHSYSKIGSDEGARLLTGGEVATEGDLARGFFYRPTIFADVDPQMRVAQEEIFGPVTALIKVRDADEAIRVSNGIKYGLSSSIFTRDVNTAFRAMRDLEAGITYVNAGTIGAEVHLPFGGTKDTGNGHREAGQAALDVFTEWKSIYVDYSGKLQRAQIDD